MSLKSLTYFNVEKMMYSSIGKVFLYVDSKLSILEKCHLLLIAKIKLHYFQFLVNIQEVF